MTAPTQGPASSGEALPTNPGPPVSADWRARLRGSRAGTLGVLAVTTVLVLLGAYLVQRPAGEPTAPGDARGAVQSVEVAGGSRGPAPSVGQPAPDFTAPAVDGSSLTLSALRGRPVWLTFGASWCAGCRVEAPDIQDAAERSRGHGTAVVSVYLSESPPDVRAYADRLRLSFTHVPDPDTRISSAYRVLGIPTHVFIDREGTVREMRVGVLTPEQMDASLAAIAGPAG